LLQFLCLAPRRAYSLPRLFRDRTAREVEPLRDALGRVQGNQQEPSSTIVFQEFQNRSQLGDAVKIRIASADIFSALQEWYTF
jgi:hypothetical protein